MIVERHNIASRIILKASSKGKYGANLIFTDVGNADRFREQGLDTSDVANRALPF